MTETNDYAKGGYVEGDGPLIGSAGNGCYIPMSPGEMVFSKRTIDAVSRLIAMFPQVPKDPEADS